MNGKMLKYEMSNQVVNYLLQALNRSQIVGVQAAKDLLAVTELLQSPKNADELEEAQYKELKNKFEPAQDEKKKK